MRAQVKRQDLLYPELSYLIIGCAFDVYNNLGSGYHEKYYHRALLAALAEKGVPFQTEESIPIRYKGAIIGKKRLDVLVDQKIVVELKKGTLFSKAHVDQVLEYLKMKRLKLAILINFGGAGVVYKRIINISR